MTRYWRGPKQKRRWKSRSSEEQASNCTSELISRLAVWRATRWCCRRNSRLLARWSLSKAPRSGRALEETADDLPSSAGCLRMGASMTDRRDLEAKLNEHLEAAQAIIDELGLAQTGHQVERARDDARGVHWPHLDPNVEAFRQPPKKRWSCARLQQWRRALTRRLVENGRDRRARRSAIEPRIAFARNRHAVTSHIEETAYRRPKKASTAKTTTTRPTRYIMLFISIISFVLSQ
jgi:hypothetical protein